MLQTILAAVLMVMAIGDEPTIPVDIMAAMASRETGCITVTEVAVVPS